MANMKIHFLSWGQTAVFHQPKRFWQHLAPSWKHRPMSVSRTAGLWTPFCLDNPIRTSRLQDAPFTSLTRITSQKQQEPAERCVVLPSDCAGRDASFAPDGLLASCYSFPWLRSSRRKHNATLLELALSRGQAVGAKDPHAEVSGENPWLLGLLVLPLCHVPAALCRGAGDKQEPVRRAEAPFPRQLRAAGDADSRRPSPAPVCCWNHLGLCSQWPGAELVSWKALNTMSGLKALPAPSPQASQSL